jgi:exopolysaccharide production protein ExoZ
VLTKFYGALIVHVALNRRLPAPRAAMIAGTGLMIAYFAGVFDPWRDALGRELMPGLPAALMIWGAVGVKWRMPAGVILWGEASYILYLVHLLVFTVIGQGLSRVAGIDPYSSTPAMLGMLAAATALSCAASVWIEQPYQRWYRARMRQAPGAA